MTKFMVYLTFAVRIDHCYSLILHLQIVRVKVAEGNRCATTEGAAYNNEVPVVLVDKGHHEIFMMVPHDDHVGERHTEPIVECSPYENLKSGTVASFRIFHI